MRINIFFIRNTSIVVTIKLKKHMVDTCIFSIVLDKFSYLKESSLIILLIIVKSSKVGFYYTVLPFNIAINIKIKGNEGFSLNPQKLA